MTEPAPSGRFFPALTKMGEPVTPKVVVQFLESHRLAAKSEAELGDAVANVLTFFGVPFEREKRLNARDRLDFLIGGGIALELKIKGTLQDLLRQLQRYAHHPDVTAIVVVTTRAKLCHVPAELGGKPIHVALQLGGIV